MDSFKQNSKWIRENYLPLKLKVAVTQKILDEDDAKRISAEIINKVNVYEWAYLIYAFYLLIPFIAVLLLSGTPRLFIGLLVGFSGFLFYPFDFGLFHRKLIRRYIDKRLAEYYKETCKLK
jgi:hypothetical protein